MRFLSIALIILLMFPVVNAITYNQEFILEDQETKVNILIDFETKSSFNFYLNLPRDVNNLKIYFDDEIKNFEIIDEEISKSVKIIGSAKEVKINYNSESFLEEIKKSYFTAEVISLFKSNVDIKIVLPEGAVLDKPFLNDLKQTSVYPEADKITTNGKSIIITWNYNAEAGEKFPLFVIYKNNKLSNIYFIIVIIILVLLIIYFLTKKKKEIKIKKIKVKVKSIEEHLKEDELKIVNILKQKGGECTQATLVTLTNMSKASLSRLLNELESRNIIKKEQRGNKNLISLKKR